MFLILFLKFIIKYLKMEKKKKINRPFLFFVSSRMKEKKTKRIIKIDNRLG